MLKASFDDHYAVLAEALPEYTICRPDADGAQGLLLQAIHNPSQRLVAIKVLLAGPLASREQQDRFRREIEILFDFQHPNIVPTYDCGSVAGRLYYVMPYINGLPVTDWALAYEPTPTRCVELFLEVCEGLSYAHRRGIIHRDVKPSNILVDDAEGEAFGRPYIVDFGLAKKVLSENNGEGDVFQTRVDQVPGTLPYMSPEQINGQEKIPDVRSDLYSLGVVFFQALSGGTFPYAVDVEVEEMTHNILHRAPRPLSVANSAVDPDLSAIVGKCLEKDRELRYRSIDDLADDLRHWQRGEAVEARRHHRWYRFRKTLRRRRWTIASLSSIILLLAAGATSTTVLWRQAERSRMRAVHDANVYQAGLMMGAYLKDGSVARDAGRSSQAIEMWTRALEIGESVATDNNQVQRYRYGARHRLCELLVAEKKPAEAKPYCEAAMKIAENMAKAYPDDVEWKRMMGFSLRLRGRLAALNDGWQAALEHFSRCVAVRRALAATDPGNISFKSELASILAWQGRCLRSYCKTSKLNSAR